MKKLPPISLLFLIPGLIAVVIGLSHPYKLADVHISDTYFVFSFSLFYYLVAIFLFIASLLCFFAFRLAISKKIIAIYGLLTIVSLLLFIWCFYRSGKAYATNFSDWNSFRNNNDIFLISLCCFILSQVAFGILIVARLMKDLRKGD